MVVPAGMLYTPAPNKYPIMLLPATLLPYGTSRPVNRLRTDMPASFVEVPARAAPASIDAAAHMAQACWNAAVNEVKSP